MPLRALISKDMLQWARRRAIGGLDQAAKHLNIDKGKLEAWETGETSPTFLQAQNIAKKLKIPFGYLYLSQPPDESLPIPDLRVKPGTPPRDPSPDFLDVLYDAMRKQEWYRDHLNEEDASTLAFVGRFSNNPSVNSVANDMRKTLGLTEEFRRKSRNMGDFYRRLVAMAEAAGVIVLRNSVVGNNTNRPLDPNEFQGFAMPDDIAPLIFVNQRDYLSAQIFTLMHELAHIWMGISGVSGQDYLENPTVQNEYSQRLANAVAAETLVPAQDFILQWRPIDDIEKKLEHLHRHYLVSSFVILRRAYDLNLIPYDLYRSSYRDLIAKIQTKKKNGGGGGYYTFFSRNSTTFTTSLLNSVTEGRTLPTQAATLLNVSPTTVFNMQAFLADRG